MAAPVSVIACGVCADVIAQGAQYVAHGRGALRSDGKVGGASPRTESMRDMPLRRGARSELGRAPGTLIDTNEGAQVDVGVLRGLFAMHDERFETRGDEPTDRAVGEHFVARIRRRSGSHSRLGALKRGACAVGWNADGPVARANCRRSNAQ